MLPSRLNQPLILTKGGTFRQAFYLQQPTLLYRPITGSRATSPVQLIVPNHGIADGHAIWIDGVQGLVQANRPFAGPPIYADVVDADTLQIQELTGIGHPRASGGQIIFQPPVNLNGCTARFEIVDTAGVTLLSQEASVAGAEGRVEVLLSDEETQAITWDRARFRLWVTMSNGDVDPWLGGELIAKDAWV